MGCKLFVGGLAWQTRESGLRIAFEAFGVVEDAVVIMDRETSRSRGFGFVTFADDAAAEAAVNGMNGAELDGRRLRVNKAEERPSKNNNRRGGDTNRRGDRRDSRRSGDYRSRNDGGSSRRDKPSQPIIDEINVPPNEDVSNPVPDVQGQSEWGKTSRRSWGNKNRRRRDNDERDNDDSNRHGKRRRQNEEDDW